MAKGRPVSCIPRDLLDDYSTFRWHRLGDAARQCGLTLPPDLHRAAADAELTRRLVRHIAGD